MNWSVKIESLVGIWPFKSLQFKKFIINNLYDSVFGKVPSAICSVGYGFWSLSELIHSSATRIQLTSRWTLYATRPRAGCDINAWRKGSRTLQSDRPSYHPLWITCHFRLGSWFKNHYSSLNRRFWLATILWNCTALPCRAEWSASCHCTRLMAFLHRQAVWSSQLVLDQHHDI